MAVQRTKPSPAQSRPAADPGLRARILLVDDHKPNLPELEAILGPLGEELVGVTSGEDALRQLLEGEFALILMDVQMPGMDGIETAAVIKQRERNRSTPIIFLTAIAKDPSFIFKGYSQGAVDYLLKPFDPEILRTKVSVFVDLWRRGELIKRQAAMLRAQELRELERRSEVRFRGLTDSMPQCVWAARRDGEIHYCNRVWREYAGPDAGLSFFAGDPRRARAGARATAAPPRRRAALAPVPGGPRARRVRRHRGLDRDRHRYRPPEARRGGARGPAPARAGGPGAAGGGEPLEGRVPRHRLPRAADAAERHPRLDPHAPHWRAARRGEAAAGAGDHRTERAGADAAGGGHPRRLAHHRGQAARPGAPHRSPRRHPGRDGRGPPRGRGQAGGAGDRSARRGERLPRRSGPSPAGGLEPARQRH